MTIHTHTSTFDGRPLAEAWAYDAEGTLLKVCRCDYYGNKGTALEQATIGLQELLSTRPRGNTMARPGNAGSVSGERREATDDTTLAQPALTGAGTPEEGYQWGSTPRPLAPYITTREGSECEKVPLLEQ